MTSAHESLLESDVLIDVRNVSKCYHLYDRPQDRLLQSLFRGRKKFYRDFWALKDVSLQVRRGEAVGIIGRNGAGKSTLLQLITGTLTPSSGKIAVRGRVAALLQLGSGFNPEFTGRENVYLNGAILGFSRAEIEQRFDEIAAFADIGDFIEQPVKTYSSGMTMRLAFSVSTCLEPEVLIVDEALAVGDVVFQRKCYSRLDEFIENGGTLLFVSHSLETVKRICDHAIYLKDGQVRLLSTPARVAAAYEFDLDIENRKSEKDVTASLKKLENHNEYGNRKAEIIDVWIENSEGKKLTSIYAHENFVWCYQVRFNSTIEKCNFGMKVANIEGLVLFATNSEMIDDFYAKCIDGEVKLIKFNILSNSLAPGEYFLSAGVSEKIGGEDAFLHRRTDCFNLKIRATDSQRYAGMVNMAAQLVVI